MALGALALHVAAGLVAPVWAQDDQTARLREALRRVTVNLQALEQQAAQAQGQLAQAQAQVAAKDAELKRTVAAVTALERAAVAGAQREERLQANVTAATAEGERTRAELDRTADTLDETRRTLERTEATRAATKGTLEQEAALRLACEDTNAKLYGVGQEVLGLYAGKGPVTSLAQREPFTQLKGVQIETIVQDYRDKLLDQRLPATSR